MRGGGTDDVACRSRRGGRVCRLRRADHCAERRFAVRRPVDAGRRLPAHDLAVLTIVFGLALILRGDESPPFSDLDWSDGKHAAMVTAITGVAIALYEWLGFIITMVLMMLGLLVIIERRNLLRAAVYACGRRLDHLRFSNTCSRRRCRRSLRLLAHKPRTDRVDVRKHPHKLAARLFGRVPVRQSLVRLPRLPGRHAGRRAAGDRPAFGHQHPAAGDLRPQRHPGRDHARRHLLRLAIWRLDHLDPDAHSRRGLVGDDLHRRLRHGQEGPRRRGALHRRGRIVDRRHLRRHHAHRGGAAARHAGAALRAAGIHRAPGARPDLPRLHVVDLAGAHAADGLHRADARHDRHRQHDRSFPLQLRPQRARRRHRHRSGGGRPVRPRRNPVDAEP